MNERGEGADAGARALHVGELELSKRDRIVWDCGCTVYLTSQVLEHCDEHSARPPRAPAPPPEPEDTENDLLRLEVSDLRDAVDFWRKAAAAALTPEERDRLATVASDIQVGIDTWKHALWLLALVTRLTERTP